MKGTQRLADTRARAIAKMRAAIAAEALRQAREQAEVALWRRERAA